MESFTQSLNTVASLGTILGQIFIAGVIIVWLCVRFGKASVKKSSEGILSKIGDWGLVLGFLVTAGATAVSLIYSDIIGYEPCKLCWVQRVFLYPQVIILGLVLWKKTRDSEVYCLALSIIGAVIAAYHFYGQSFNPDALPACDVAGGASCALRFFVEFGYVTIPLMSLTAFLLIIVSMLLSNLTKK
ncbi:MAG: disulfide bond formation protein B [bacterium]|nr:disulfide bond formation protein B [bacterium]